MQVAREPARLGGGLGLGIRAGSIVKDLSDRLNVGFDAASRRSEDQGRQEAEFFAYSLAWDRHQSDQDVLPSSRQTTLILSGPQILA